jgi:hypothetical protein
MRDARHEQSAFARWGRRVSERPWPYGIGAALLLLVLAIPVLSINLGQLDAGTDPPSDSSRKAYDLIADGFGAGANGPLTVVVSLPNQSASDKQALLSNLADSLQKTPGVGGVQPPTTNSGGTTAIITVIPTTSPSSAQTEDLVNRIRNDVLAGQDEQTYLVGTTAGYVDFTEKVAGRMLWLIGAVVLLALILLTVAFRSLVIGIKAALLNLLSVGAAYGVIVAVFQWGWGSSLVGIDENVPIPSFVPMLMFAIVFGLSMDYEVFLLSRVHEAWTATNDSHRDRCDGSGDHDRGGDHDRRLPELRPRRRPDREDAGCRHGRRSPHRCQHRAHGARPVGHDTARRPSVVAPAVDGPHHSGHPTRGQPGTTAADARVHNGPTRPVIGAIGEPDEFAAGANGIGVSALSAPPSRDTREESAENSMHKVVSELSCGA